MIRIRLGMVFLRSEHTKLESPVTMITERPITNAPFNCTVTASEEQIPSTTVLTPFQVRQSLLRLSETLSTSGSVSTRTTSQTMQQYATEYAKSVKIVQLLTQWRNSKWQILILRKHS